MRKLILITLLFGNFIIIKGQTFVSTKPENKKVILEEFTGTECHDCPGGDTEYEYLLSVYPGTLFVTSYHPSNSMYSGGDPMVRSFPSAFFTGSFLGTPEWFIPSGMINRKIWSDTERIQGPASWEPDLDTIKNEPSPLNVGVSSTYNLTSNLLTVNVQIYFTADVKDSLTLYAELTEDGIIADQEGGSTPYTHNHVFRESFVKQWGNPINPPTTKDSLKIFSYTFDNSVQNYNMSKCEIIAFIRDANNQEIISTNGAYVGQTSSVVNYSKVNSGINIYPNPANDVVTIDFTGYSSKDKTMIELYSITGGLIKILPIQNKLTQLNISDLSRGVYVIKVMNDKGVEVKRVVKE